MTTHSNDAKVVISSESLEAELQSLLTHVRENSGTEGTIDASMLPSIRAGAAVVGALLNDGQLELASSVLQPLAREVDRIIARGY